MQCICCCILHTFYTKSLMCDHFEDLVLSRSFWQRSSTWALVVAGRVRHTIHVQALWWVFRQVTTTRVALPLDSWQRCAAVSGLIIVFKFVTAVSIEDIFVYHHSQSLFLQLSCKMCVCVCEVYFNLWELVELLTARCLPNVYYLLPELS